MYNLFIKYYDNVNFDDFSRDLDKKEHAIIMRENGSDAIVGFSTLAVIVLYHNGRKNVGIFSGDTVIDKKYWGYTAIHTVFIKYLVIQRIRHFASRVYWFLITKGYKTYLLMANNWSNYFPRYDKEYDPAVKSLTKCFCESLYPGVYDDATGLLTFGNEYQKLKQDVAEIDESMREKYPKIAFFEAANPTWREGTELPCLGEIDWPTIFKRSFAFFTRRFLKTFVTFLQRRTANVVHAPSKTVFTRSEIASELQERQHSIAATRKY